LGTRVEVKNLNSIKHLKHAVELEVKRLIDITETGGTIVQETRSYDADRGITFSIRVKEDAEDYRYFPEPDLAPFSFTDDFIQQIKQSLPELSEERSSRYVHEYGLPAYDAEQLAEERSLSDLFDRLASATLHRKNLANFLLGPVRAHLNDALLDWNDLKIHPQNWNKLLEMVVSGQLAFSVAVQKLLPVMLTDQQADPLLIANKLDLIQDAGEDEVNDWVQQVLSLMPDKVEEYRKGKKGLIGLFVGEVKKISKGKADPKITTAKLTEILNQKP